MWDTNTFLIALDQAVIRCNLDENVADTLITFEDNWPNEWYTELYPLSSQYLIISRNMCDWYLMDSNLELLQEIDTEDEFGFTFFIYDGAYPAEEISGGYLVSLYDGGFTEHMIFMQVEDEMLHVGYGIDCELDSYRHLAYPVALNDSIFFFTDLGGPFVVIGEYTDDDIGYYGGGNAISYGCTVAKMNSYLAILRQMDDLHRVRIYDDTFPEYHEEEFSVPAPPDAEYWPSEWHNYIIEPYIFFERKYHAYSGELTRIYQYSVDTYEPTSNQDIPKPELTLSCYPNPFNPELTVSYSIPQDGTVEISVYNIKGQKVRSIQSDYRYAGNHNVVWDGRNDCGQSASSGLYFVKISYGNSELIRKAILMK